MTTYDYERLWFDEITHYKAEAPPSRSAGLPMLNRKHKRVAWGGSRQSATVTRTEQALTPQPQSLQSSKHAYYV